MNMTENLLFKYENQKDLEYNLIKKKCPELQDKLNNLYSECNLFLDKDFPKKFGGFKVKVGFGAGNTAKIPWIAFLDEESKVSNGVYPVYLYYKEEDLLILSYGVSEENKTARYWNNTENLKRIDKYFAETQRAKPDRYGSCLVTKYRS